ncbi:Cadherin-23 [Orchesella cincta]|uniref:Cadherin-23 n=1 Tax=Orchesella cincta TaxID=48709 RepID=A0A1D2NL80_ORCCI|nr:Cadherin-23 [Orchesella cincta]
MFVEADEPLDGVLVEDDGVTVRVNENVGLGTSDGFIIANIMLDGPGNVTTGGSVYFSAKKSEDPSVWHLYQSIPFDFEALSSPVFDFILASGSDVQSATIFIVDVNDNVPRFVRTEPDPILPVKELVCNPDVELFKVLAVDDDVADNSTLIYDVTEGGGASPFRINSQGSVFCREALDYLKQTSHRLDFTFKDQRVGEEPNVGTHSLTIMVDDVPNRPPEFTRPPNIRSVEEGSQIGTTLFSVQARDGDYQLNWPIKYEIFDEHNLNLFEITDEGDVKVLNEIDAENEDLLGMELLYTFTIVAKEDYNEDEFDLEPELTETRQSVTISIEDINVFILIFYLTFTKIMDNPPRLCNADGANCETTKTYAFSIREDHTGQALEEPLTVKDIDYTTKNIRFRAAFAENTPSEITNAFSISPETGIGEEAFQIVVKDVTAIDFENEFWHNENNEAKPATFTVEFTASDADYPEHKATAVITATITDLNDNPPRFQLPEGQTQFQFAICENTPAGTKLKNKIPNPIDSKDCKNSVDGEDVKVFAEDFDATPSFGQPSVIYRWSRSSRTPPIDVNPKTGEMTMNDQGTFDYERLTEETFVLEAADSDGEVNGLVSSVEIRFQILDVNDVPVDLRVQTNRVEIPENTSMSEPVIQGIIASDVDVTANIKLTMEVANTFARVADSSNKSNLRWQELHGLEDDIKKWFKLEIDEEQSTDKRKVATIILGELLPDREGNGEQDVDRVDLVITATDENTETNDRTVSQVVTITLKDINDNPPTWPPGEDSSNLVVTYLEDEEWGDEGDQSSDSDREIHRFRVVDPDTDTNFIFVKSNPECRTKLNESMCNEILELIELVAPNVKIGSADLRRVKGKLIDREKREYFDGDSDTLEYTITISDGENSLESKFSISVGDRNDNNPIFNDTYGEVLYVDELVSTEEDILTLGATDKDHPEKYGNVSYLIVDDGAEGDSNNGMDQFNITLKTGILKAVPGAYNWTLTKEYRVQIRATDYYRPSQSSGSNSNDLPLYLTIRVNDKNNHDPEFLTKQEGVENPLIEIKEREPVPNEPFAQTVILRDLDNSDLDNGKLSVEIIKVVLDKDGDVVENPELMELFRLGSITENKVENKWELPIIPTQNFTGLWGTYTLTLNASDGVESQPSQRAKDAVYVIRILNENLNAPAFIYPEDNTTSIYISITDSGVSQRLVDLKNNETLPDVLATDPDEKENGVVRYGLELHDNEEKTECRDNFQIDGNSGRITLKERFLPEFAGNHCILLIKAYDMGDEPQSSYRTMDFLQLTELNIPPMFNVTEQKVMISENNTLAYANLSLAYDLDIENENPLYPNDQVYYFIKGGAIDVFDLREREFENENGEAVQLPILAPKEILDREEIDEYRLTIYATNNPTGDEVGIVEPEDVDTNNKQFLVVNVEVLDVKDTDPKFATEGNITGGFSTTSKTDDVISIVTVIDPDLEDPVSFEITSGFTASDPSLAPNVPRPFELVSGSEKNTVAIVIKFDPQPNYKGYYRFQITATDTVGFSVSTICQMYMVTDANKLNLYFINDLEFFTQDRQDELSRILSEAFSMRCNIDRVIVDTTGLISLSRTIVETHFIDLEKNEPVLARFIINMQYRPDVFTNYTTQLVEQGLNLAPNGIGGPQEDPVKNTDEIIIYILIAGVAVLVIALLIISASCFYNNRGLSRRVRALTATAFGSQKSDLNRLGVTMDAPNTNEFAIEGSNPVWTIDTEPKRFPDFDAESVGSGGSVLIGAEDEEYFKSSSKNPMFQAEDVVANYDSDVELSDRKSYGQYDYEPSHHNQKIDLEDGNAPFAARTTRNPLMDLGKSIDVDEPDPYEQDADFFQIDGNADDAAMF